MSDGRRRTSDGVDAGSTSRADAPAHRGDRSPYYPPHGEPLRAPWDPAEETTPGRRRSVPGARDHLRKQSPVGRFFTTWGWRAYAIPVLVVLTALVIADSVAGTGAGDGAAVGEAEETPALMGEPPRGEVPPSGELPDGG
ncbi:hypothetical protein G6031_18125, partial [Dietzia sp. CQ4]|nr:hypothetical protein [Dietzia sp. CQ4]